MTFDELQENVVRWAELKGILVPGNQVRQFRKMEEEVQELGEAIHDWDRDAVLYELGDVLVTCIIQAALWDLSAEECLEVSYNKISKRKGTLVDGVFVKEAQYE